jgi:hypothetical protein
VSKSILQTEKECYFTKRTGNLHLHHIFYGRGLRQISDREGFVVYLIPELHNMSNDGVHFNRELDLRLKRECQAKYEETHSRKEFIQLIGRNYILND